MTSDAKDVMRLRTETGAGVNDCKKALTEAAGNFDKAKDLLRMWGGKIAEKKAARATSSGLVGCYLHPTPETARLGVMVQFNCETDFVARNPQFQVLLKDVAQHVAAMNPTWIGREEVPAEIIEREKAIYREQVKDKPAAAQDKIIQGKLDKFFAENCLLEQAFVKDPNHTIQQLITEAIAKIGENMKIGRVARFEIGS